MLQIRSVSANSTSPGASMSGSRLATWMMMFAAGRAFDRIHRT